MHTTYFSSTVVSLGGRGYVSFSSNDCSHFLNESFQRHPLLGSSSSACCSFCSCCACSTPRVPINPSYLYGWRQSNLIQWSCSRRLVLGGRRRYSNGLDPGIYDVSCTVKRRSGDGRIGKTRYMALEDESERCGLGDVEAMISLLSEEVDEECFGGRERSQMGSIRRVEMESRENYGREGYARKKKNIGLSSLENDSKCKIELKERSNRQREERKSLSIGQSNKGRKKIAGLTAIESESKGRFESVNTALGEEDFSKYENRKMRKEGSASSYYSLSSSSEFESDVEAQAEHGGLMKELSSEFRKDSRTEEGRFSEEVEEMHVDDSVEEASRQKHTAVVSGAEWDWRKNSEKKLAQVSVEEDQSRKESFQMDSRMTRIKECDYGKTSSSREQVKDAEETLTMVGSSKNGKHKQYSQSESRIKYKEGGIDKSSRTQNQFSDREEKESAMITRGKQNKIVGTIAQKYDSRSEQLTRISEQQTLTERASNLRRQYATRMKNWEGTTTSVLSSGRKTEEQHHMTGERTTGQGDLRKNFNQGFTVMSETCDSNTEKTSILQSGSRMKSQSQNSGVASSSGPGAGRQHSQTDEGVVRRSQSQKGFQDATTSSAHSGDSVTIPSSRSSSEKRVTDQEINLTSTVRRVVETREKHSETDERVMREESRKWSGKPKVSSFHENDLKEATSSGASLTLVSPFRSQKIDMGEDNQRSSPARMVPPSAQLVSRGSFHIEPTSGITSSGRVTPDLDIEPYGGVRRDDTYQEPSIFVTNVDALGSAYRSQKFSTQYVGDFVEQARYEISTSEIEKEKKVSETILVHEDENHGRKALGKFDSGDSQLKEHESKRTSGVSGTKGPSDEMWDVTDPSFREPSNAEDPEVTIPTENASENAIVRKSGRSLWNIIGDIARIRWGSHTDSPGSAVRSGSKSSPDESVGTEAWFSGREHEGSSDDKAEKKIIVPQEPTSYEQQLGKSSPSEGEASDTMRSKDKERDTETYVSDPLSMIGTGSAAISLTSDGENLGSNEDRRSFPGTPSGRTLVESSLPLSARDSKRSSSTDEISETGKIDVSRHGSVEKMEQPGNIRRTEILGSEGKDRELKRRRLQRDKQIMKDNFDDWEEAYKHESEQRKIDEMFMREALLESKKAADAWEVPVGAVLVQNGTIIARGYNLVEELRDSTAHAEMICIREASNQLKTWRLANTTLYVTLEPCPMCAGAILQARIDTLVWGAPNKLLGADGSWVRLFPNSESQKDSEVGEKPAGPVHPFHPNMKIRRGVLAGECADAMQQFFQLRRKKKTKNSDLPTSSTLAARRHPSKFISKMQQMFHIMFCL